MPSSPKYNKRRRGDFYPTPSWCTDALLDGYELKDPAIVEPSAGRGAISKVIREHYPDCLLIQHELYENKHLEQYGAALFGDFLTYVAEDSKVNEIINYVIANPPFSLAQKFIITCRERYPNAEVIMLLPFSFLGSAERHDWWTNNIPSRLDVLSNRPSFTNDGKTDSSVYAWFHWSPVNKPTEDGQPHMTFLKRRS